MKELCKIELDQLIRLFPGDYAVCLEEGSALSCLYFPSNLPSLFDMDCESFRALGDLCAVVVPADRELLRQAAARLSGGHAEEALECRFRRGGGFFWLTVKMRCLGAMGGCPVILAVFATSGEDVSQLALLDKTEQQILVVDLTSREVLYANAAVVARCGGDFYGKTCYAFSADVGRPCPWCPIREDGGDVHIDAAYIPEKERWYQIDCRHLVWHGRVAQMVSFEDVTERCLFQLSLETDRDGLQRVLDNIPSGVLVVQFSDGKRLARLCNPSFKALFGPAAESPEDFYRHVCDADLSALQSLFEQLLSGTESAGMTFRLETGGDMHWFKITARSVRQQKGTMLFACFNDVTAEKRAEEEKAHIRRIYEAAVDSAGLALWDYDIDAHRIEARGNKATLRNVTRLGLSKTLENVPQSLEGIIEESSWPAVLNMYRAIDGGAPSAGCEVWYKRPAGEPPYCERLSLTAFSSGSRSRKAFGIACDITAEKLEAEKYHLAEHHFAMVNSKTVFSFQLSLTANRFLGGRCIHPRLTGLFHAASADEFLRGWADVVGSRHGGNAAAFSRQRLINSFLAGTNQLLVEFPFSSDDAVIWLRTVVNLIRNPDSGDIEVAGSTSDVSAVHRNEVIVDAITNERFDGIAVVDLRRNTIEFVTVRMGFERPIERREKLNFEDFERVTVEKYVVPEDREFCRSHFSLKMIEDGLNRNNGNYNFVFRRILDGVVSHKYVQYIWLDKKRRLSLFVQMDITRVWEKEQVLADKISSALEAATRANEAKTVFVSRISHDIRTPLAAISSMTDFAIEDVDNPKKLEGDLARIKSSDDFLLALINDILDISRIDNGSVELRLEPFSLWQFFAILRRRFKAESVRRGVSLTLDPGPEQVNIICDHHRLEQMVGCLVSNALRFTPSGGAVKVGCVCSSLPDGCVEVSFTVADTGIGMSEEFQTTMFEPFAQEFDNPDRPRGEAGTGLGLALCRRIAAMMGGSIEVKSRRGVGTMVTVKVTFNRSEAGAGVTAAIASEPLQGTLLLAEDNEINTEIAVRLLQGLGLHVDCAADGQAALEMYKASAPGYYRAVLMDLLMPLMDGIESSRAIRALDRPDAKIVPIIALTADTSADVDGRCRAAGMDGVLCKPIEPGQLRQQLSLVLSRG